MCSQVANYILKQDPHSCGQMVVECISLELLIMIKTLKLDSRASPELNYMYITECNTATLHCRHRNRSIKPISSYSEVHEPLLCHYRQ